MLTALDKLQHELWLHELRKKDPKTYFSQEMVWDTVEAIRSIARDRKLTISMTGFEGAETTFYADGEVTILRSNSEPNEPVDVVLEPSTATSGMSERDQVFLMNFLFLDPWIQIEIYGNED